MQRESVGEREIAHWPGMSAERTSRLLNGLYLAGNLMVTRTRAVAGEIAAARGFFGWKKG